MLSDRLKSETDAHHERIEQAFGILMRPELTLDIYRGMLNRLHAFFVAWEARAEPVLIAAGLEPLFDERLKQNLLRSDLAFLAVTRQEGSDELACGIDDIPLAETLPEVLGAMYVTEGSTLGGQIIAKQLERRLCLTEGSGYSYFRGQGRETMTRWRTFVEILNSHVAIEAHDSAVKAAGDMFEKLQQWMRIDVHGGNNRLLSAQS